jgi:hypothetical protein
MTSPREHLKHVPDVLRSYCQTYRDFLRKELAIDHFVSEYRARLDAIDTKEAFLRLEFLESFALSLDPFDLQSWLFFSLKKLHFNNFLRYSAKDIASHISVFCSKSSKRNLIEPEPSTIFPSEMISYFGPVLCALNIFEFVFQKRTEDNQPFSNFEAKNCTIFENSLQTFVLLSLRLYDVKKQSRIFNDFLSAKYPKSILVEPEMRFLSRIQQSLDYFKPKSCFCNFLCGIISLKYNDCNFIAVDCFKKCLENVEESPLEALFLLVGCIFSRFLEDMRYLESEEFASCLVLLEKFNNNEFAEYSPPESALRSLFAPLYHLLNADNAFSFPTLL